MFGGINNVTMVAETALLRDPCRCPIIAISKQPADACLDTHKSFLIHNRTEIKMCRDINGPIKVLLQATGYDP